MALAATARGKPHEMRADLLAMEVLGSNDMIE